MTLAAAALLAGLSLYDQAVVQLLRERFASDSVSYMLLDATSGQLIDARWPESAAPVPAGSLVKPFTALAWGRAHDFRFPEHTCAGAGAGCWLPRGHGRIGIVQALAHSCNAYFDALSTEVPFSDLAGAAQRFSLAPPPPDSPPLAYVGRAGLWQIAPLDIARAYAALLSEPDAAFVREGMAACVGSGTCRAVGKGLAKTGTAPCVHAPKAAGDGYVIAIDPDGARPRVLLVRVHGVPGAVAARTAGEMMRVVREGK